MLAREYICPTCNTHLPSAEALESCVQRHIENIKDETSDKVSEAPNIKTEPEEPSSSLTTTGTDPVTIQTCLYCGEVFDYEESLRIHELTHLNEPSTSSIVDIKPEIKEEPELWNEPATSSQASGKT